MTLIDALPDVDADQITLHSSTLSAFEPSAARCTCSTVPCCCCSS